MEPSFVVHPFDEFADRDIGFRPVSVFGPIDLLIFERFHETLRLGVVVGVAPAAHADRDAVLLEQVRIGPTGILHATIGVMHQPRRRLPLSERQA